MYKKITLFSLFFSIIGIVLVLYRDYNSLLYSILNVFDVGLISRIELFRVDGYVWQMFFNLVLLIGGLTYYITKEKETRILRFMFSALFIQYILFFILRIYSFFTIILKSFDWKLYLSFFTGTVVVIFVLYFVYKSLLYLNKLKELDYETFVYTESTEISYFNVNNWVRLLHLILDSFIFFLIAFQFLFFLARVPFFGIYMQEIGGGYNERTLIIVLSVVFRTIFYFSFESLFGGTPAKFLTESRVVDSSGLKPSASSILKRTLIRSIPFNGVSFLFGANWHDSYSETQVCKEKTTGVVGSFYFLLIPLFVISFYSMNFVGDLYVKSMIYKDGEMTFQENNAKIVTGLKTLSPNSVLVLKNISNDATETKFLKVENISNSEIEFSVLKLQKNITYQNNSIQKQFELAKDTLQKIKINKRDLQKLVLNSFEQSPEYYEDDKEEFTGIAGNAVLKGEYINRIIELNSPDLVVFGVNVDSSNITLQLQNQGIPAEVESIVSSNGKIDWIKHEYYPKPFSMFGAIELRGVGDVEDYEVNVTVNDSLYRKFTYKISSTSDPRKATIKLIK
ncbi:RDD family protein [Flavobacterium sp. KJJ]|uniref:RDD family protein n=1 Tax=Flavobacterium sp. KJJ TaxID=1270193 RepID=UPI0006920A0B|nr:RDD family protein [Flavobacterium sp. KJJ]